MFILQFIQNNKEVTMRINKIHLRHYYLRKRNNTKAQNLDKFFVTKTYVKNVKTVPMNTPEMRAFSEHMQEVQSEFRIKSGLSEIAARGIFFNV